MKLVNLFDLYVLFVIILIKGIRIFPSRRLEDHAIKAIACIAFHRSKQRRRLREAGLDDVFDGTLNQDQRRDIVKSNFYVAWQGIFSMLTGRGQKYALSEVEVSGLEYLRGALKKGHGVILWESNSFGNRISAKQILLHLGFSIEQIHAANHFRSMMNNTQTASWVRRRVIDPILEKDGRRSVAKIHFLPSSDSLAFARRLQERLRHNAVLCVAGDGSMGQNRIPVRFLGRDAHFSTGMISLARMSHAPILPLFSVQSGTAKARLIIERPIQIEEGAGRQLQWQRGITQYANLLESYIRTYPEQYMNWLPRKKPSRATQV